MPATDKRVDAYIAASADFAKPILEHLRSVVHQACPDVEETIKWGFPHFMYRGMLCSMASFKAHCAFGFWKGALILDDPGMSAGAMGSFGRIASLKDLPPKQALAGYVKKAMALNEQGVATPRTRKPALAKKAAPAATATPPDDLVAALRKNAAARKTFEGFSPSARKEYVQWITEAKGEATRQRRLETAIEWMAEGKPRNWKYLKK